MTPTLKNFRQAKKRYSDMLVLMLVDDFCETFDEDARTVSRELGLSVIARDGVDATVGFPQRNLETYLGKLLKAGHRVAVCEPVTKTKIPKNKITRQVIE